MVSPAVPALSASTTDSDIEALTFADLGLPEALMKAVADLGYTTPSPIQAAAIPALLAGQDITGVAQTGTGKTAAFGLPLLAAMDPSSRDVQALVLTPTRELALQVSEAIETMAKHLPQVRVLAVYGGASFVPQLKALSSGVQVVVGTPGRIIDHLDRGTLKLGNLKFLVLDEADEMLRMGFAEDVENILTNAPKTGRQTALFSATMPPPIKRVADQHMTDPIDIAVSRQSSTVENVRQTYAVIPFSRKTDALARVIEISPADATIVFTRTKDAAENVGSELIARGISAATISGDVAQRERERIVERLRNGQLDVLVATDVAARGLDVDRIDLVVNYDAPGEPETYVHRIGRTGRAGRTGEALTFFTPRETGRLRVIEKLTRQKLIEITLPTASEVSAQRAIKVLTKAAARAEAGNIDSYRTAIETFLTDSPLSVAELASALAALVAGDTGKQVTEPEVLVSGPRGDRPERSDRGDRGGRSFDRDRGGDRGGRSFGSDRGDRFGNDRPRSDRRSERPASDRGGRDTSRPSGKRYSIAVGHADGVRPAGIVGAITAEGGLQGRDLGRIDIFDNHSIVEIVGELTPAAFTRIGAARVSGRELRIKRHYEDAAAAAPARRSFRD
jgi:ATP-dependent RNA helicase DeaD